jgi:DNA mismatch endonuclease (patch repair protein)
MDTLSKAERSHRMSLIRGKNTRPELFFRSMIHALGYRFRLYRRDLPGTPDLVFPGRRKVIFVHGCFWHCHRNCKVANFPKTRSGYWRKKFRRNRYRDRASLVRLRQLGWETMVVWECELYQVDLPARVQAFLGRAKRLKRVAYLR